MENKFTDEVILKIIKKLQAGEGTDEEITQWFSNELAELPGISDLIFYSKENLSPEEILILYKKNKKPIIL